MAVTVIVLPNTKIELVADAVTPKTMMPPRMPRVLDGVVTLISDVLLMRPLLSHCSGHSDPDTARHRRILHLEFSPVRGLPDGYEWHTFVPPGQNWK